MAFAWQEDVDGQFDIRLHKIGLPDEKEESVVLSGDNKLGDWHPALAVDSKSGKVAVFWDAYDGVSFSVRGRVDGEKPFFVANSSAFEGRADAVFDWEGRLFVAWEEGARNWGKEYRRFLANPPNFNDGPGWPASIPASAVR